jgi:hypothetical protein
MKKPLLMASILTAGLGAGFATNAVLAMPQDDDGAKRCKGEHHQRGDHQKRDYRHDRAGKGMHHMGGKKMMEREFSADEIRTLMSARLIMKGNPNVKVGTVTAVDGGYKVTVVTQDNSLVEELALAKNSMPKDRYEKILERKAKREAMKERRSEKHADTTESEA